MAYEITALVGRPSTLARLAHPALGGRSVELSHGFALVPLDQDALDGLDVRPFDLDEVVERLGPDAAAASADSALAYLHLETFGATVDQTVAVWLEGELVYREQAEDVEDEPPSALALRLLGVAATDGLDEFATLGLGRHRSTEEWLAGW